MLDPSLITILPAQQVSGIQTLPLSSGITSQGAAPLLANLPPGTVLKGFIINRDASGNPILRTEQGDIRFVSQFFLKIGSEVVIRIGTTAGALHAHIISVDGQPPEIAQNISAFAQDEDVVVSSQQSRTQSGNQLNAQTPVNISYQQTLQPSSVVRGIIIAPSSPEAAGQTPHAGTQLTLKTITINVPPTPSQPSQAPALPLHGTTGVSLADTQSYAAYARVAATAPAATLQAAAPLVSQEAITATSAQQSSGNNIAVTSSAPSTPTPAKPHISSHSVTATELSSATAQYISFSNAIAASSVTLLTAKELPFSLPTSFAGVTSSNLSPILLSLLPDESPLPGTVVVTPTALPSHAMPQQTLLQHGASVTGKVIGNEAGGQLLVQTNLGVVRLQAGVTIPVGSNLAFEVTQVTPPAVESTTATAKPAPLTELAQQWVSLQHILGQLGDSHTLTGLEGLLLASSGAQANTALAQPVSGQAISSAFLLFLMALQGGNFSQWLGNNNARWLEERGNINLLKKAEAEFLTLSRHYAEAQPHQWQPIFFPVAVDGTLQQVRMFVKRDRKQGQSSQASGNEEDTRFVVEVDLTQLGELQMDGFVRKQDKELLFDMIIRSLQPLSKEIQNDIVEIYTNTGMLTGYKGSLTFQAVKTFPVNPMEEIAAAGGPVVA